VWTSITSLGCNGQLKRCFHPNVKDTDLNLLRATDGACGKFILGLKQWSLSNCNEKDVYFACQRKIGDKQFDPYVVDTKKDVLCHEIGFHNITKTYFVSRASMHASSRFVQKQDIEQM
jgi:hypothetical protein